MPAAAAMSLTLVLAKPRLASVLIAASMTCWRLVSLFLYVVFACARMPWRNANRQSFGAVFHAVRERLFDECARFGEAALLGFAARRALARHRRDRRHGIGAPLGEETTEKAAHRLDHEDAVAKLGRPITQRGHELLVRVDPAHRLGEGFALRGLEMRARARRVFVVHANEERERERELDGQVGRERRVVHHPPK